MRLNSVAAGIAATMAAATAQAQLSDVLANGGFDLDWNEATPPRLAGIRPGNIFGMTNNGDPDAFATTAFSRSAPRSVAIGPTVGGAFNGFTTDTLDNMPPNFTFLYYDVPVSWQEGDIEWSIWYLIPSNASLGLPPTANWPVDANPGGDFEWPEGFAPAAFKIDVKGAGNGFQNNASYDGWDLAFRRDARAQTALFWGTTNGQWVQRTFTWPARTPDRKGWKDQVEDNAPGNFDLPPEGTWPNPPGGSPRWPDRAKLTIGRFNPGTQTGPGTIYFDDFTYVQRPAGPAPCGPADIGGTGGQPGADGVLDNNDFIVFIDRFFNQDPAADIGQTGGTAGADGVFDNNDFIVFIDLFFAGCGG